MAHPIAIIEDDDYIRQSFVEHFANHEQFECVFSASSVERFEKYYKPSSPLRVLILDIGLPGKSGLDAIEGLKKLLPPEADIIMFTSFNNPDMIFRALCAGATGYLLKNHSLEQIETQLGEVVNGGGSVLSPSVARRIVEFFGQSNLVKKQPEADLKPLERQVAHFLMEGKTYPEIARSMSLSVDGVKYHQKNIFRKLNISSRGELGSAYAPLQHLG